MNAEVAPRAFGRRSAPGVRRATTSRPAPPVAAAPSLRDERERARVWELSVESGLQSGALVQLDPTGVWSIGPDETDDVMIRDPELGAARVLLRRDGAEATLRVVAGEVSCGAEPLAVDRTIALVPGTTMRLGGVALELVEAHDTASARLPAPAKPEVDSGTSSRALSSADAASPRRPRGRTLARLGAGILGVAALGSAWFHASGGFTVPTPERPSVESLLARSELSGLDVSRQAGLPMVDGVLSDEAALRELETVLAPSGDAWVNRVETDASLATQVLDVLRVNGADAELVDSEGGTVSVRTALPTSTDLDALREMVQRDVPALNRLDIENVPPPVVPVRDASPPDPGKRVAMVVAGPPAHVVTEDRTRYFRGAVLPSGHRIVAIEGNRVSLERDGERTTLDF